MADIEFYKLQASGNDFILIDRRKFLKSKNKRALSVFVRKVCQRKKAVGADGVLFIETSKNSDFKMRIFNSDGSEPQMCGNGARCAALWKFLGRSKETTFDTKAGEITACLNSAKSGRKFFEAMIKIKMTTPFGFKENISLGILKRKIKVNLINTGVPHAVIFVDGLGSIDVEKIGSAVRSHRFFGPRGANVNFVQPLGRGSIAIRTYERGVEAETLACGTGSVAAALVYSLKREENNSQNRDGVKVKTKGGETLTVDFSRGKKKINDVWLGGKASLAYRGKIQFL